MVNGIPYFGEDNNQKWREILDSEVSETIVYDSLYNIVDKNTYGVIVIDNKYLTWLHDIVFNYRDKECYIPYYSFELFNEKDILRKKDNDGHLIITDKGCLVRYNYKLEKYNININNLSLIMYDLHTNKKVRITTDKWFSEEKFNIEELYQLYIDSAYTEDDYLVTNHLGGYHYISRAPKGFKNREMSIRERHRLNNYSPECETIENYRDVRRFRLDDIVKIKGLRNNNLNYHLRKLNFESYLYCCLRQGVKPDDREFAKKWETLGKQKDIIKYGNGIMLIFKSYWLDEYRPVKKKTWSRI